MNYTWEFDYEGKKVELYGPTPNYTFEEPGIYDIQLKVTDREGNVGFDNVLVTINPIVPEDDENDDGNGKGISRESKILMWLGVIGLVFIVIIVCMVVIKKRGKKYNGL